MDDKSNTIFYYTKGQYLDMILSDGLVPIDPFTFDLEIRKLYPQLEIKTMFGTLNSKQKKLEKIIPQVLNPITLLISFEVNKLDDIYVLDNSYLFNKKIIISREEDMLNYFNSKIPFSEYEKNRYEYPKICIFNNIVPSRLKFEWVKSQEEVKKYLIGN